MMSELCVRELSPDLGGFEFRAEPEGDGLSLSGWIARFGEVTEIIDHAGHYLESIKPGAFARTIADRGPAKVKMMYNHGKPGNNAIGDIPIGVWTRLEEKRQGLWGEGRILDAWHTIPVRAAIEAGAIDGMSFAFRIVGETWRKATTAGDLDRRTLTEIALHEAGVVNYQAYQGTSVSLRSALEMYRRACDPDEAANLSRSVTVDPDVNIAVPEIVAVTPAGVTRRELQRIALPILVGVTNVEASGDAQGPARSL